MAASNVLTGVLLSVVASLLAELVEEGGDILNATDEQKTIIEEVHQAAQETADEFEGVTEELLILVLKSEEVRTSAEDFISNIEEVGSDHELRDVLELTLSDVIDPAIEVDVEEVTDRFISNLQSELVENPEAWEEIVDRYGEEVANDMSEMQKEIHRSLFLQIERLQEDRAELQEKLSRRFKINVVLGTTSVILAIVSVYLSYITFF